MLPNSKAPSLATWAPEGGAAGAGPAWGGLLVPRTPAPSWVRAVCRDALFLIPAEAAPRVPDKGAPWLPPGNPEDAPLPEEVAQGLGSARSGGSCPLHLPLLSPDPRPLILPPLPTGRVLERGSCDFQSCSEKGRPRGAVAPMPPPPLLAAAWGHHPPLCAKVKLAGFTGLKVGFCFSPLCWDGGSRGGAGLHRRTRVA